MYMIAVEICPGTTRHSMIILFGHLNGISFVAIFCDRHLSSKSKDVQAFYNWKGVFSPNYGMSVETPYSEK